MKRETRVKQQAPSKSGTRCRRELSVCEISFRRMPFNRTFAVGQLCCQNALCFQQRDGQGLHYILSWEQGTVEAGVVMRGGGCCGRTRFRWWSKSACSGLDSV